MNTVTSFFDLDNIYSLQDNFLSSFRTFSNGKLRIDGEILPGFNCKNNKCTNYFSGDNRANQTASLAILHSLFFRLHNKMCDGLMKANAHWDDNRLFLESRELTISIYQSISYNHWLTAYIGLC